MCKEQYFQGYEGMFGKNVFGHGELTGITSGQCIPVSDINKCIANSKLQSNVECGTFDVNKFDGKHNHEISAELSKQIYDMNIRCQLEESKARVRQLENNIEDISNIEEENSYLRGLLKLYL